MTAPQINFIISLPRTRTAWLANFLTYGASWCCHDALRACASIRELPRLLAAVALDRPHLRSIGVSDSALGLFYPLWKPLFPEARVLIVTQPAQRALANFLNFTAAHRYPGQARPDPVAMEAHFARMEAAVDQVCQDAPPERRKIIHAQDLDRLETARQVWEFCVPGDRFDPHRWQMLDAFNINIIPEKIGIQWNRVAALQRELDACQPGPRLFQPQQPRTTLTP